MMCTDINDTNDNDIIINQITSEVINEYVTDTENSESLAISHTNAMNVSENNAADTNDETKTNTDASKVEDNLSTDIDSGDTCPFKARLSCTDEIITRVTPHEINIDNESDTLLLHGNLLDSVDFLDSSCVSFEHKNAYVCMIDKSFERLSKDFKLGKEEINEFVYDKSKFISKFKMKSVLMNEARFMSHEEKRFVTKCKMKSCQIDKMDSCACEEIGFVHQGVQYNCASEFEMIKRCKVIENIDCNGDFMSDYDKDSGHRQVLRESELIDKTCGEFSNVLKQWDLVTMVTSVLKVCRVIVDMMVTSATVFSCLCEFVNCINVRDPAGIG